MNFTPAFIRQNIRFYEEAKEIFPLISQYEKGEVNMSSLMRLRLGDFAEFHYFVKTQKALGFELDVVIKWRKLKKILIENTQNSRFKDYISRRTEKEFILLLTENTQIFDRLLNGRILRKSTRRSHEKRSYEKCEGLSISAVAIINYLISSQLDEKTKSKAFETLESQSIYRNRIKWYVSNNPGSKLSILELAISKIPKQEVKISTVMVNSISDFIKSSDVDFRKLNSEFLIEVVAQKIKDLMQIPIGTNIKCQKTYTNYGKVELSEGNMYQVITSNTSNGFLRVCVLNDLGQSSYYEYSLFEDMSVLRDSIFKELGIT
jgi:hypothetical protein